MVVAPFAVDNQAPKEEEIKWYIKSLQLNRYGGPSGMSEAHLKQWLTDALDKECLYKTHWKKVANIVQTAFHNG